MATNIKDLVIQDDNKFITDLLSLPESTLDKLAKCVFLAQEENRYMSDDDEREYYSELL